MSRIGLTVVLGVVLVLAARAAAAQPAPPPSVPDGEPVRTWGLAYEHTTLGGDDWAVRGDVETAQGKDTFNGNLSLSSRGFHVLRGWLGRRRWLGPNLGGELVLGLGLGHAFEKRSSVAGSLGSYPVTSSFHLIDGQSLFRLFLLRRVVYVELGLLWQRIMSSTTVSAGATTLSLGRSEDSIGGSAGVGAECPISATFRIGVSLASAGFLKMWGPYPTRTQLRFYLTW